MSTELQMEIWRPANLYLAGDFILPKKSKFKKKGEGRGEGIFTDC